MDLIVVSSPGKKDGEIGDVIRMFEAGLQRFHLRKPGSSRKYIKEFLDQVPKKYRSRIIIHSNHSFAWKYKLGGIHISKKHRKKPTNLRLKLMWYRLRNPKLIITRSCRKLGDLEMKKSPYNYIILSPIFDSISINSLSGGFNQRGLISAIEKSKFPVYAMGGVEPGNFQRIAELGFRGPAVLGYIWSSENPVEAFTKCLQSLREVQ